MHMQKHDLMTVGQVELIFWMSENDNLITENNKTQS
jgi:hypothetical protein